MAKRHTERLYGVPHHAYQFTESEFEILQCALSCMVEDIDAHCTMTEEQWDQTNELLATMAVWKEDKNG